MFSNVEYVCRQIADKYTPVEIILFNLKQSVSGDPRSFKICIIKDTQDKVGLERQIYLGIDCDIPYDVLLYTPEEWSALTSETGSFAYRIKKKGTVMYEQAP